MTKPIRRRQLSKARPRSQQRVVRIQWTTTTPKRQGYYIQWNSLGKPGLSTQYISSQDIREQSKNPNWLGEVGHWAGPLNVPES